MRRLRRTLLATLCLLALGAPAASAQEAASGPEVVVSFTFDGTYKGQDQAAQILADNGMAGTFYVNSGYLDYPAYLSVDDLRSIARNRNEVGGASLFGEDLSKLSRQRVKAQVCNDRATLANLGMIVTSFSYPYGQSPPEVKWAVQECGYNSGREIAGLYESDTNCSSCPKGETLPPTDDFRIRTNDPSMPMTVETLERHVQNAVDAGGGWVPLTFTKIGVYPNGDSTTITPEAFQQFVEWLKDEVVKSEESDATPTISVKTVDQVMGGDLKPVTGTPLTRLVPHPSAAVSQLEPLSQVAAWNLFGLGIGQAQILMIGIPTAIGIIVTYRIATRGNKYARQRT